MNKNTPRPLKRYSNYKFCIVKECKNTSVKSPHKLWIQLPREKKTRETWLKLVGRDPEYLSHKTLHYFCDDHFDLENDMENYLEYKLMGSIKQIRMKPKAVPSRSKRRQDHPHKNIERNEIVENTYCIATSLYIRPGAKLMTGTEDYENETNTKHIPKKFNTFSCICGETFSCVTSMDEHRKLYKHYIVYSGKKDVIKATPAVKLKESSIDREKAIRQSKNIIYPCDIKKKTQDDSIRENEYLTEAVPVGHSKEMDQIAASEFILPDVFIKQEIIEEICNNKAEDDKIAASQKDKIAASELITPDVFIKQEIIEEISNKKAEDDEIAASQKEKAKIAASELIIPDVFIKQEIIEEICNNKAEDDKIAASQKDKIAASELITPDVFIKQEIIEEISNKKAEDDEIAASQKEKAKIAASELIIPDVFIKQEIIEEISNKKAEDDEIAASQKEKAKIAASELIIPDVFIKQEIIEEISNKKAEDDEIAASQKEKAKIAASELIIPDVFIKQEIIEEISNKKAEDDELAASQKEKAKIAASELIIPDVFIKQEIMKEISNNKAEDDEIAASQLTIPSVFIEQEKEESSIKKEKDDEKVASELAIPSVYIHQEIIIEECLIKKEKDDEILTSELIIPPEVIKQESEDEYTQPTILKRKKFNKKEAIKEYEECKKTYFKVIADKHNIPKSVLHRHHTRFMKKQDLTALGQETEKYIVKYLNICSEWGYPIDAYDLRLLVKGYLDRVGITAKKFTDNMPGPHFVKGFLSRNQQDISPRLSENYKRVRAAVCPEIINQYFDELGLSLDGVPSCNLVNYDETNLSDDPGGRKIISKRGAKYPERTMYHSKGSISLMMAAAADGTLLPPYVVYKSQHHLYDTWTTGGPEGCRYNRNASGWFDGHTFEEWMRTVIYSYFKDKTGKKLLIGDHLSSHLTIDLIRECKERDIHFVFVPSYSTYLTQPLDVAFFVPMEIAWRNILFHWKKTDGRVQATLPKPLFPQLLNKLLQRLDDNAKENILSAFSKAGISPLNRKSVLDRLPNKCVFSK